MAQVWDTLLDMDDLEVYSRLSGHSKALAVTFDFSSVQGRPPHIPAANFFEELLFDHVHVVSKRDIWYQTLELKTVVEVINSRRDDYNELITFGNSMGGYGAILISGLISATKVLAFAPQFSVSANIFPEEARWRAKTSGITFLYDNLEDFISEKAEKYIIYDPFCADDRRHTRRLQQVGTFTEIRLPFSGHFPSAYLYDMGLLPDVMRALIFQGCLDAALIRRVRDGRKSSFQYFQNLALTLQSRSRPNAVRAAHRAYALAPDRAETLLTYVTLLAFDPDHYPFVHMAVRLLQTLGNGHPEYDGLKDELWQRLSKFYLRN